MVRLFSRHTDYPSVDRIVNHPKLTFIAERMGEKEVRALFDEDQESCLLISEPGGHQRRFPSFMMGTTANTMTGMQTIVESYGRSRHAFPVVSKVGAFFIDFTNAVIITMLMNILK